MSEYSKNKKVKRLQLDAFVITLLIVGAFTLLVFERGLTGTDDHIFPLQNKIEDGWKTALAKGKPLFCLATKDLKSRHPLRITMVFGYKDTRPSRFVGDFQEKAVFAQFISRPCPPNRVLCDFRRDPDDEEYFRKSLHDGEQKIELRLVNSSVGFDDEDNRGNPFQDWQSAHAKRIFLKSLSTADIVFYDGHSRVGGGPDFYPPRLTAEQHVDYGHYKSQTPGLKAIAEAMRSLPSDSPLKYLGLFSCASEGHFLTKLRKNDPKLSVFTSTNLIYYADAIENSTSALEGLLQGQCLDVIQKMIRTEDPLTGSNLSLGSQ
jgi:hypothetical protein